MGGSRIVGTQIRAAQWRCSCWLPVARGGHLIVARVRTLLLSRRGESLPPKDRETLGVRNATFAAALPFHRNVFEEK